METVRMILGYNILGYHKPYVLLFGFYIIHFKGPVILFIFNDVFKWDVISSRNVIIFISFQKKEEREKLN